MTPSMLSAQDNVTANLPLFTVSNDVIVKAAPPRDVDLMRLAHEYNFLQVHVVCKKELVFS